MLVLTRKLYETIVIDDNIIITIVKVCPDGSVRIGIEAPKELKVLRGELQDFESDKG